MSQGFQLSTKEKQLEVVLFLIAIISFITIIIGIYSENNGLDYDYILVPCLFSCYIIIFGILTPLGLKKSDLFLKWSFPIHSIIFFIAKKITQNEDKAKEVSFKVTTASSVLILILLIISMIKVLFF